MLSDGPERAVLDVDVDVGSAITGRLANADADAVSV
jgi:hypothetical protein